MHLILGHYSHRYKQVSAVQHWISSLLTLEQLMVRHLMQHQQNFDYVPCLPGEKCQRKEEKESCNLWIVIKFLHGLPKYPISPPLLYS